MRGKRQFAIIALFAAFLMMPLSVWGQGDVVQKFDNGSINWSSGKITATGIGAPPGDAVNVAQARMMARRAALLDARRNLLEITQGVQVDSMTLVKNAIVQSDIIRSSVQGVVRNAQVVDTAYMSDGSVEVTVVMSMKGDFASTVLPQPSFPQAAGPEAPAMTPSTGAAPATPSEVFTGLVVDARGLEARPAMSPKVVDESGKEIYGSAMVNRDFAVQQGMAGYAKDLSAAQGNNRVTDNPLTVKAIKAEGPGRSDIVISNADASKLMDAAKNLNFLQKCRVMIVLD
jgi:hypothetical protein